MKIQLSYWTYAGFALFLGLLIVALVLIKHDISVKITPKDQEYIGKILKAEGRELEDLKKSENFKEQIETILKVQNSAFETAPEKGLIPIDSPREPQDLYESNSAYCSDRARTIYKALKFLGFEVRYASVYAHAPDKNFIQTMLTRGNDGAYSHALVEVLTAKGWMVVDTRVKWISLDKDQEPQSLHDLQMMAETQAWPAWSSKNREDMYFLLGDEFYILYGLYSRHGRFYAPYTPYIPDIDWSEFVLNLK